MPLPLGAVLLGTQAFYAGDAPSSVTWAEAGPTAWSRGRLRTFDPADGRLLADVAAGRPHWHADGGRLEVLDDTRASWIGVGTFDLGAVPFDAALLPDGSAVLVTVARAAPVVAEGPDGVILRLGRDGSVRELARVPGQMLVPLDVAQGRIAAGTHGGGRVLVWTLDARGAVVPVSDTTAHPNGVGALAWLADGRLLSGGHDDRVVTWDAGGHPLAESSGYGGRVLGIVPSADGARFLAVGPMEAQIRGVDGQKLAALGTSRCQGTSAAWSPDGALAAVTCAEGDLGVFDATTGASRLPDRPRDGVASLAWSPDGAHVAVGSFGRVEVYDARTGAAVARPGGHRYRVEAVRFEGDALLATSDDALTEHAVAGWALRSSRAFEVLPYVRPAPPDPVVSEARTKLGSSAPPGVPLASAGDRVALARGAEVVLWSVAERRELVVLRGHLGEVTIGRFAPDGRLATGSADGTVVVWPAR